MTPQTSPIVIRDKEIETLPEIKNQRLKLPRILGSTIKYVYARMCILDGLIIERSNVSTVAHAVTSRNVIIGPSSVISNSHLKNTKVRQSHAVLSSTFKNVLFYNCLFEGGLYRYAQFEECVFINCTFSDCKFESSLFHHCSFTGSVFYKCGFIKLLAYGPFLECDFMPNNALGRMFREHHKWPEYAAMIVKSNFLVCSYSERWFDRCAAVTNMVTTKRLPHWCVIPEPKDDAAEAARRLGDDSETPAQGRAENTAPLILGVDDLPPLSSLASTFRGCGPGRSTTIIPRIPRIPRKHRKRAFVFATSGVR